MQRLRPTRWTPVEPEESSVESNFAQAAQALELASAAAARKGDSVNLVNAAHGYLRMIETFAGIPPHMWHSEGSNDPVHEPGFRGSNTTEREEEDNG